MLGPRRSSSSPAMSRRRPGARRSARWSSASTTARRCATSAVSGPVFPRTSPRRSTRGSRLCALPRSPFPDRLGANEARGVRFVRPELVAEVDFRGWTADGLCAKRPFKACATTSRRTRSSASRPCPQTPPSERPTSSVTLTHPDRIYWPDAGVTKQGLADYYAEVWPLMTPFIVGPGAGAGPLPGWDRRTDLLPEARLEGNQPQHRPRQRPGGAGSADQHSRLRRADGACAVGGARNPSLGVDRHRLGAAGHDRDGPRPRRGRGLDVGHRRRGGSSLSDSTSAGLAAFVKTSGGKGLHVVSPMKPKAEWPAAKAFAKSIADAMAADSPERYVSTIPKARRHGKILIDYLRNQRGTTAVAALFHPRPARRAGLHAARLGRARARNRARLFHRPQHADTARVLLPPTHGWISAPARRRSRPGRRQSHPSDVSGLVRLRYPA